MIIIFLLRPMAVPFVEDVPFRECLSGGINSELDSLAHGVIK
jgi:hypothetical protein